MPSDAIRGTSSAYFYEKEKGGISVAGGIFVGKEKNWRQDEDLFPGVRRIGGLFLPRSTTHGIWLHLFLVGFTGGTCF